MVKSSVEKLADMIGFEIGASDDITQGDLLNGFCRGLSNSILKDSDLDMQFCCIAERLNGKAISVLRRLNEFIEEKETGHGREQKF